MDGETLERFYRETLEERLVEHLSERIGISLEQAMDLYYHSRLCEDINAGTEGIQYLDYKVLTEILCETEGPLVASYR